MKRIICFWKAAPPTPPRPRVVRRFLGADAAPRPRIVRRAAVLVCFAVPAGVGGLGLLPDGWFGPPPGAPGAGAPEAPPADPGALVIINEPAAWLLLLAGVFLLAILKGKTDDA